MILGVGTDIIEVERIRNILSKYFQRFLHKIFTPSEQEYCLKRKDPAIHLAGRFAAKEAIVKALGTGFSKGLNWLDFEIRNDPQGKPAVFFSHLVKELFGELTVHISISHCHQYATAFAVWTKDD